MNTGERQKLEERVHKLKMKRKKTIQHAKKRLSPQMKNQRTT